MELVADGVAGCSGIQYDFDFEETTSEITLLKLR